MISLGGPRSALGSAVACSILLGVFEGVGVLMNRIFSEGNRQQLPPCTSLFNFVFLKIIPVLFPIFSTRKHVKPVTCMIRFYTRPSAHPRSMYFCICIFSYYPYSALPHNTLLSLDFFDGLFLAHKHSTICSAVQQKSTPLWTSNYWQKALTVSVRVCMLISEQSEGLKESWHHQSQLQEQ